MIKLLIAFPHSPSSPILCHPSPVTQTQVAKLAPYLSPFIRCHHAFTSSLSSCSSSWSRRRSSRATAILAAGSCSSGSTLECSCTSPHAPHALRPSAEQEEL